MEYVVSRKALTVYGETYATGAVVPMDAFPPQIRRRLVEYRRVVPRGIEPAADAPEIGGIVEGGVAMDGRGNITVSFAKPTTPTCGELGGLKKDGEPCGMASIDGGMCRWHRN